MNIFIVPNMPHAMRQAPKLHASKMKTLPSSSQRKPWVSFIALCSFLSLLCSTFTPFCKIHMGIVQNISFHRAIFIISNTCIHPKALIIDFELIITNKNLEKLVQDPKSINAMMGKVVTGNINLYRSQQEISCSWDSSFQCIPFSLLYHKCEVSTPLWYLW